MKAWDRVVVIVFTLLTLGLSQGMVCATTDQSSPAIGKLLEEAEAELHQTVWKSLGPAIRALHLSEEQGDTTSAARARLLLGKIYLDLKDTENAHFHLLLALDTFVKTGDRRNEAAARNRLGRLYRELDDEENALKELQQAVALYREVSDDKGISRALNSLGAYYWDMEDLPNALAYFNESLKHLEKLQDPIGLAAAHNNIGLVNQRMDNREDALRHYAEALETGKNVGYKGVIAAALINRATLYAEIGQLGQAWDEVSSAESIAASIGALDSSLEAVLLMADIRRRQGRFRESLQYRDKADQQREAISEKRMTDRVAQIKAEQELKEKEREIRLLEQENRIQELTIQRQQISRNLLILSISFLLLLLIGVWTIFLIRRRASRKRKHEFDL